jgi:1-acyl-sn-glycerol-3-phosphate acyltransferase
MIPMPGASPKGLLYTLCQLIGRHIMWASLRVRVLRPQMAERDGPYILALTHLSHLDPFISCIIVRRRQIDWMARVEFFTYHIFDAFMRAMDAICVRRFGVSANAARQAIERLHNGRIVGICPEGGVAQGAKSVMRGAQMKHGISLIACRSGVPILPCIMLGTDKLNCVPPWIPFRRGRLYVAFGSKLIVPPKMSGTESRAQRRAIWEKIAEELSREYQALFKETMEAFSVEERFVP